MSGYSTNGLPNLNVLTGLEQAAFDTEKTQGIVPESGAISIVALATAMSYFQNFASKTTVAGSRYIVGVTVGVSTLLNGVQVLNGATGGTDKFIVELHDSAGNLLATSATAGVTVGTAGSWQQIPFTAQYLAAPGNYFIVLQTNGTTATPAMYNAPVMPLLTGSATGTFGTAASITPPTTYTANVGPVSQLY